MKPLTFNDLIQTKNKEDITYNDLLFTVEWDYKRKEILKRDENRCSKCSCFATTPLQLYDHTVKRTFVLFGEDIPQFVMSKDGKYETYYFPEMSLSNRPYFMNVHHKYYIINRLPWEYKNDALITLCNWCHLELHQNEVINVLSEDERTELKFQPCKRCNGAGWFPEYSHVHSGICFECEGARFDRPLIKL